jgi:hypothetical protein
MYNILNFFLKKEKYMQVSDFLVTKLLGTVFSQSDSLVWRRTIIYYSQNFIFHVSQISAQAKEFL